MSHIPSATRCSCLTSRCAVAGCASATVRAGRMVCVVRRQPSAAGVDQPHRQCCGRHARLPGTRAGDRPLACRRRPNLRSRSLIPAAACPPCARPHLQTLLHDQGRRRRAGPRARHFARHRPRFRRRAARGKPHGGRRTLYHPAARPIWVGPIHEQDDAATFRAAGRG